MRPHVWVDPAGEGATPRKTNDQKEQHVAKSNKTVDAAKGRQERDSKANGATTPQERQQQVSQHLDEKGFREGGRFYGESR